MQMPIRTIQFLVSSHRDIFLKPVRRASTRFDTPLHQVDETSRDLQRRILRFGDMLCHQFKLANRYSVFCLLGYFIGIRCRRRWRLLFGGGSIARELACSAFEFGRFPTLIGYTFTRGFWIRKRGFGSHTSWPSLLAMW